MSNTESTGYDEQRWKTVDGHIQNLYTTVGSLEKTSARVEAGNASIIRELQTLTAKSNEKEPENTTQWVAIIISCVVAAAVFLGAFIYPFMERVKIIESELKDKAQAESVGHIDSAYKRGKSDQRADSNTKYIVAIKDLSQKNANEISTLKAESAAAVVSRESIGKYAKENRTYFKEK